MRSRAESSELRDCRCGAKPGAFHVPGCDVARCSLCGGQLIACDCIYRCNGIAVETMEETHPDIFEKGPTEDMYGPYDAEVERLGGRLPWTGEYPGSAEARALGFWCRMVPGRGWTPCEPDHPEAMEDVTRLVMTHRWDRFCRRWVKRSN